MSTNRENIVWQAEDGTWSMGMFECYPTGDMSDPDWDHEWNMEYNHSAFEWVTRKRHETAKDAQAEWDGSNPGGHSVMEWREESRAEVEGYEAMRTTCIEQMGPPRQSFGW